MYFETSRRRSVWTSLCAEAAKGAIMGVLTFKRARGKRLSPDSFEHAHAFENSDGLAFDVDRCSALTKSRCKLNNRDPVAQAVEPVSCRQTCEACATHQNGGTGRRSGILIGIKVVEHQVTMEV